MVLVGSELVLPNAVKPLPKEDKPKDQKADPAPADQPVQPLPVVKPLIKLGGLKAVPAPAAPAVEEKVKPEEKPAKPEDKPKADEKKPAEQPAKRD